MEASVNVAFFGFALAGVVACAVVSTLIEIVARGNGGKVTYAVSYLVSLVSTFLAHHWENIGVWTTAEEWIRYTAIPSIIVMALFISAIGPFAGKAIGKALMVPSWLKSDAIVKPPVDGSLEGYCCPSGCIHDFTNTIGPSISEIRTAAIPESTQRTLPVNSTVFKIFALAKGLFAANHHLRSWL